MEEDTGFSCPYFHKPDKFLRQEKQKEFTMKRREILKTFVRTGTVAPFASVINPLQASQASNAKVVADKNLVIITTSMGFYDKFFLPGKADDLDSSKLVSHLKPHYNDLTLLQEIHQPEIGHGHGRNRGILSLNTNQTNGPYTSLDQFARERIAQITRFKSIHMGDTGVVWDKSSRQVPTMFEEGPKKIYDKLFKKSANAHELELKHEVLRTYKSGIPNNPFANTSYKQAIQEMEEEVATDVVWEQKPIPKVECDTALHLTDAHDRGNITPFAQHLEFVHLGLKHKRCQIFTAAPPYIDKTHLGARQSYHACGHQLRRSKEAHEDMLKIEDYIFRSISGFIGSLRASNLLDDTIVMVLGGFCDPGRHNRNFNPVVLIGGGFRHQGIVQCKEQYRLSHLYVSILHQMGIDVDEFASFKGDLDKVLL